MTRIIQHWLFKTEPNLFSIDDLAERPHQIERWDGVRNYQARNWLHKSMKVGDLGFFYHSSCKIPGIVGIVEIVSEAYPDPTAFDPSSRYYDAESNPENPRWYCVDVKLVRKFKEIISLEELRQNPKLKEMRILQKGNRLSITPVTENDWQEIVNFERSSR